MSNSSSCSLNYTKMRTLLCVENATTYDSDEVLRNDFVESSDKVFDLLANRGV